MYKNITIFWIIILFNNISYGDELDDFFLIGCKDIVKLDFSKSASGVTMEYIQGCIDTTMYHKESLPTLMTRKCEEAIKKNDGKIIRNISDDLRNQYIITFSKIMKEKLK